MRCNECAPLLEDFLDQKLVASTEGDIAEHLTACESCAREYVLLHREWQLYTRSEFQIPGDFWTGVQARIARENGSRISRLVDLFMVSRISPITVAIAGLLIVMGFIGVWRYIVERPGNMVTAGLQNTPPTSGTNQPDKARSAAVPIDSRSGGEKENTSSVHPFVGKRISLRSPRIAGDFAGRTKKPGMDGLDQHNQQLLGQNTVADLDAYSTRHLDQVEMLLRSFKNGRLLRRGNTLDLTYESRLSETLLVRNVLLRRDAELVGDVPLTRLLDEFEPFLVEIANLRDNSDSNAIRQVRADLTKAQIIGARHSF